MRTHPAGEKLGCDNREKRGVTNGVNGFETCFLLRLFLHSIRLRLLGGSLAHFRWPSWRLRRGFFLRYFLRLLQRFLLRYVRRRLPIFSLHVVSVTLQSPIDSRPLIDLVLGPRKRLRVCESRLRPHERKAPISPVAVARELWAERDRGGIKGFGALEGRWELDAAPLVGQWRGERGDRTRRS
tara:strand:+ start:417 stop:965 length:549 start_codon:yes stop_codon:yes gene_type:complete